MKRWVIPGALFAAVSIAGALGVSHQRSLPGRCDLDGSPIDPLYQVTVVRKGAAPLHFACVVNACIWLAGNSDEVASIWVMGEETGEKVAADEAFYVASSVVTTPHSKNRIHVFSREETAERHARTYIGERMDNPLRVRPPSSLLRGSYRPDPKERGTHGQSAPFPKCFHQPTPLVFCPHGQISPAPVDSYGLLGGFSTPPEKPPRACA